MYITQISNRQVSTYRVESERYELHFLLVIFLYYCIPKEVIMIKTLYSRHQYFFNMLAVLVLLVMTRTLDSFAWTPAGPDRLKTVLLDHLYQFFSFLPFIFLLIFSYTWAIRRKYTVLLYLFIIFYTIIGPVLFLLLSTWLETVLYSGYVLPFSVDLVKKYSAGASLVLLFLSATYFLTHLILQAARQRENSHKAETLSKDIHLKMLRYQINPHFLFNVLNSIYALIDENTEKAKKLVLEMSDYYRYTLNKQQETISIEKEVESVAKYLEIQKIRFEEEFHFEIDVDDAAKSVIIPLFAIHLLIENAVKYGKKTEEEKLIIRLSVKFRNRALIISVSNTGRLLDVNRLNSGKKDGTGNGIENIKYRLGLFYDDNFYFSLKEENGWVNAVIEIKNIDPL
jgi:two-component system, LytTR family, sensor kinase